MPADHCFPRNAILTQYLLCLSALRTLRAEFNLQNAYRRLVRLKPGHGNPNCERPSQHIQDMRPRPDLPSRLSDIQLFSPVFSTVFGTDGHFRKLMTRRRFTMQSMFVRTSSFAPRRLGRSSRRLPKVVVSPHLSSQRLGTRGSQYTSRDGPRRPTLQPGKTHRFIGGPVLNRRRRPISSILYYYSVVIINRATISLAPIEASHFRALIESQTRELAIVPTRISVHLAVLIVKFTKQNEEETIDVDSAVHPLLSPSVFLTSGGQYQLQL